VGTFEKRKNIPFLLEGFAKFSSHRSIKLLLIGLSTGKKNSDDTRQIQATIEQYQLQDRVIVAGYLSDGDLAFFYRRATAYFFPSVYEGFGIPLLEAFMYGLPVAAANATALPEIAGTAALYFDPHDQGSLLACMEQLHENEPLRKELIEKGYDRAKQFRWSESVEQFVTLAASV
jgi:glycosyltransferase involved in cell wall biosynthesis